MSSVGNAVGNIVGEAGRYVSGATGSLGGTAQNIAGSFTPQNNFRANQAPITNQNFAPNIASAQAGFGQNYANQNALAAQLQAQMYGNGPNPAQVALQQGTNRAIQQGAGQIASQKGISPALAQRMAMQNAAMQSQAAAGQGALLSAQQQMGAQQSLGGLYNQMGSQQLQNQSTLQNAQAAQNNALVASNSNVNTVNAGVTNQNTQALGNTTQGLLKGAGTAAMAHGGMVQGYADGGQISNNWGYNMQPMSDGTGPSSQAGQYLNGSGSGSSNGMESLISSFSSKGPAVAEAHGGQIPNQNMQVGGKVPGKASVKGNSYSNDTVPAMVSPGEIVLPRSVTTSKDAPKKAAAFVAAVLARNGKLK